MAGQDKPSLTVAYEIFTWIFSYLAPEFGLGLRVSIYAGSSNESQ